MTAVTSEEIRDGLFAFIDKEVAAVQERLGDGFHDPRKYWREDGRLSRAMVDARREVRMASAEAGYFTMFCPEVLGGAGLGARQYLEVWEGLCHRYGSPTKQLAFHVLAQTTTGPVALWSHAQPQLREEIVPRLARGELTGSFAMSEPDAGSDAWMMTTRGIRDGDDWILNGTKQWASWAPTADFLITFAVTDPEEFAARRGGLTCFYVPATAAGFAVDSVVKVFDEIGGEECILSFTDVRVPDAHRLGEPGRGFPVAMQGSGLLKLTKLGRIIGLARWAHDQALDYARVRRTFGKPLVEHQTIQNMLAENCVELHASKLMAFDMADKLDRGEQARAESAMSHAYVHEAAYRVYDRSMQILGGMGISNDAGMIEGWHTLRVCRLSEGPTEIQYRSIANYLLAGKLRLD